MKTCARCGKGPHVVVTRSHSMVASRRAQRPNLQWTRWLGRRVRVCAPCLHVVTRENNAGPRKSS